MIRIVCAAMEQQFGARPARRQIAEVAREMVARYPQSLRDEPGEATVFGESAVCAELSDDGDLTNAFLDKHWTRGARLLTIFFWGEGGSAARAVLTV